MINQICCMQKASNQNNCVLNRSTNERKKERKKKRKQKVTINTHQRNCVGCQTEKKSHSNNMI